ncbi:hypothetical protein OPV22_008562 [Ensete ventricosum]|uniref:Trafficking protein particle complex subunit 2-like protein n=1 Tax=Ensete ventricosum TaxID=4639 RepID=A0AAV8PPF0_ENSVE|nr:hypothetical protein OPV22_008562 [Ensete ventricosum]
MIVCVAVIGHQNNPLYLQSFTEADDALKLHHIVHCSLDVVDERVNNPKKSGPTLNETFLGMLYPTENYKVYGYLTNTKVKFLMVTTDLDVKDADVRSFFRRFHAAYVDAVSNPFHVPGKKITSKAFAERVSGTRFPSPTATPRSSLEYCRKHVDSAPYKSSDDASKVSDEELKTWEAEFVKVDQATLFDVILVSISSSSLSLLVALTTLSAYGIFQLLFSEFYC